MTDILSKITSYNLFNNLVPGVVFSYAASSLEIAAVGTGNLATDLIIYYFIGVLISRFGSLFVEPILKFTRVAIYADYTSYLNACANDKKIELLVEDNNQYRTYISALVILILALIFNNASDQYQITQTTRKIIVVSAILMLFILAYRKQTSYIRKRIDHSNKMRN